MDCVNLGSSLSLRSYLRVGSSLSVNGAIHLGNANTKIEYDTSTGKTEFTSDKYRGLSLDSSGGTLHGVWSADQAVSTSDRRLKRSIMPLYKAIAETTEMSESKGADFNQRPASAQKDSVVNWVLRELRPVSFSFKSGPEAKHSRYGFVAQELQQVLPAVVRSSKDSAEHLSVVYQDLIALLTLATQTLQDKLVRQEEKLSRQELVIEKLTRMVVELDSKIEQRTAGFAQRAAHV